MCRSAQFFAEIEAMRIAGITAGCTLDTFCPEANVTRRQMAAFFARALGLYWASERYPAATAATAG